MVEKQIMCGEFYLAAAQCQGTDTINTHIPRPYPGSCTLLTTHLFHCDEELESNERLSFKKSVCSTRGTITQIMGVNKPAFS